MSLTEALFTPAQSKLLGALYGHPERWYHVNELIRATGLGSATVQRELKRLLNGGIVLSEQVGNLRRIKANGHNPVFGELVSIVAKTVGVAAVLQDRLAPHAAAIRLALIYGSIAKQSDHGSSDVDLIIVSDTLGVADLLPALIDAETRLGRKISPVVYTGADFAQRRADPHSFVSRVLAQPTLVVLGLIDEPASAR